MQLSTRIIQIIMLIYFDISNYKNDNNNDHNLLTIAPTTVAVVSMKIRMIKVVILTTITIEQ